MSKASNHLIKSLLVAAGHKAEIVGGVVDFINIEVTPELFVQVVAPLDNVILTGLEEDFHWQVGIFDTETTEYEHFCTMVATTSAEQVAVNIMSAMIEALRK